MGAQYEVTPQVSVLVRDIRQAFVTRARTIKGYERFGHHCVPSMDGGVTAGGRKCSSVWERVAAFCGQTEIPYQALVNAVFELRKNAARPPYPNRLLSQDTIALARQYVEGGTGDSRTHQVVQQEYVASQRAFATHMTMRHATRRWATPQCAHLVLADDNLGLSVLFRFCMARQWGHTSLAAAVLPEAAAQYAKSARAYDAVWGSLIPPDFREVVRKEYRWMD